METAKTEKRRLTPGIERQRAGNRSPIISPRNKTDGDTRGDSRIYLVEMVFGDPGTRREMRVEIIAKTPQIAASIAEQQFAGFEAVSVSLPIVGRCQQCRAVIFEGEGDARNGVPQTCEFCGV